MGFYAKHKKKEIKNEILFLLNSSAKKKNAVSHCLQQNIISTPTIYTYQHLYYNNPCKCLT